MRCLQWQRFFGGQATGATGPQDLSAAMREVPWLRQEWVRQNQQSRPLRQPAAPPILDFTCGQAGPIRFPKRTADEKPRPQGIHGRGQSGVGIPVNTGCLGDILAPDQPGNIRRFTYLSNRAGLDRHATEAALLRQPRPRTAVMSRAATTPNATAVTRPLSSPLRLRPPIEAVLPKPLFKIAKDVDLAQGTQPLPGILVL